MKNKSGCRFSVPFCLSDDIQILTVNRVIRGTDIKHPLDCLYFTDNTIFILDSRSLDMLSSKVKVIIVDENNARKTFGFGDDDNMKFSFEPCEIDRTVCFSDHGNYCVYKIKFSEQIFSLLLGEEDDMGQNQQPDLVLQPG